MRNWLFALCLTLSCQSSVFGSEIAWVDWSDAAFAKARSEKKLVLFNLGAVWCHWCHVMEETTYRDRRVIDLIKRHYVPISVDQDARPDLSIRYEKWGWPATILFDGNGKELAKLSGYIAPDRMASLLKAFVDDPTPGPSVTGAREGASVPPPVGDALEKEMLREYFELYDSAKGGWGRTGHKFLNWHCVELALRLADENADRRAGKMARQTMDAQLKLIDPVWGGVYQYSTGGDWDEPHFEKIMQMQGENLRIYAEGFAATKNPAYRDAAKAIAGYLARFLTSPDGAFYTSQDADVVRGKHSADYFKKSDAERVQVGIPRVDTNIYARENGWAIHGLATAYAYLGERQYLDAAKTAARWVIANRSRKGGGFSHGANDPTGPHLGDSLYMARAFLTLALVTGDRDWLSHATRTADFIGRTFKSKNGGYVTSVARTLATLEEVRQFEENAFTTRLMNLLHRYTGDAKYQVLARHGERFLRGGDAADHFLAADALLAFRELREEPMHVTIVGPRKDADAATLYRAAIAIPSGYKIVQWYDPAEGPLPGSRVKYPKLTKAAAFACSGTQCSLPAFKAEEILDRVRVLSRGPKQ